MDTVKHCNEVQAQQLPFQLEAAATVLARGTIIKKDFSFIIIIIIIKRFFIIKKDFSLL
jgi:hypothetical protein